VIQSGWKIQYPYQWWPKHAAPGCQQKRPI